MEIPGHAFVVSGGGSGLGAACVRMLAGAGGRVIIADINEASGAGLAAELGAGVRFTRTDVTDEVTVQSAVRAAVEHFGGLHGSIQCAGIAVAEKVLGKNGPHSLASFAKVINVNLIGTFNVNRLAAATMAENTSTA